MHSNSDVRGKRSQNTIVDGRPQSTSKHKLVTTVGSNQANRSLQRQSSAFTGQELRTRPLIGSSLVKNITSAKQSLWVVQATLNREHAKSFSAFPVLKQDPSDPNRITEAQAKAQTNLDVPLEYG